MDDRIFNIHPKELEAFAVLDPEVRDRIIKMASGVDNNFGPAVRTAPGVSFTPVDLVLGMFKDDPDGGVRAR